MSADHGDAEIVAPDRAARRKLGASQAVMTGQDTAGRRPAVNRLDGPGEG
ncbi:hypothetical protein AB0J80_26300 [Actinoplanes sp. NPDC049548]